MTTLPLPVDEATAAAFESVPPDERERLARCAATFLQEMLDRRARSERFQEIADRLGAEAQANGWNDELDAALLRGDFDDDE